MDEHSESALRSRALSGSAGHAARRLPREAASVLVAGTVRNCVGSIEPTLAALRRATAPFRHVRFLLVESDSEDGSAAALAARAAVDPGFRVLSLGDLRHTATERTDRLAICRNRVVDAVAEDPDYTDIDYVILADMDGVNAELEGSSFDPAWAASTPWDVITANQTGPYYDIWALRHPIWSPNDCWRSFEALAPLFGEQPAYRAVVAARQMRLKPTARPIEVESAFGGLGIYSRAAFLAGRRRYAGRDPDGRPVCEHIAFHRAIRAAGFRIFIDPAMLNNSQVEHVDRPNRTRRLLRRVYRRALAAAAVAYRQSRP